MIFNLQTGRAQPLGRQSSEGRAEPTAKIPYCKYRAPDTTPRFVPIRDTGHVGGRTPLRSGEAVRSSPRQHACSRQDKLA
jgi:hypothetical protein